MGFVSGVLAAIAERLDASRMNVSPVVGRKSSAADGGAIWQHLSTEPGIQASDGAVHGGGIVT